jgi:hypothetical protein
VKERFMIGFAVIAAVVPLASAQRDRIAARRDHRRLQDR